MTTSPDRHYIADGENGGHGKSRPGRLHRPAGLRDVPETRHIHMEAGTHPQTHR